MKELFLIQSKLKAPKGKTNNFGGYKYRSCEDILEAAKPILKELSCTITLNDDIIQVGDRYYLKATVTLRNSEGETEQTTAWAREEETKKGTDASQITGAASSYARKYALCGLFAIDDGKDADSLNTSPSYTERNNDSDYLAMAKQEIDAATEVRTLTGIYNNYTNLQGNARFIEMLTKKRKELQNI